LEFSNKVAKMNSTECEGVVKEILVDLDNIEFVLNKSENFLYLKQRDEAHQQEVIEEIEKEIESSKDNIKTLQENLKHEQRLKNYKCQYEDLAKLVNEYPAKKQTNDKIVNCKEEIAKLERDNDKINSLLTLRQKQLFTIVSLIQDLQTNIDLESTGLLGSDKAGSEEVAEMQDV